MPHPPRFWQAFLAADLGREKSREFFENLGTFPDLTTALLSWPKLTNDARKRIERMDQKQLQRLVDMGVWVLERDQFPETLDDVPSPPHALFAWGFPDWLSRRKVAIVGTRRASPYGKAAAQKFAESLSRAGVCVISGGALGIDGSAHAGALEGGSPTVAVLGTGVDQVYPSANAGLFDQLRRKGCLVSQFACGMPSLPENFVKRNQIIASLAEAIVVIEAPEKSGALTTATAAADLNRPVFVVPGPITKFGFAGSHRLIREGATLVDHPNHILEELGIDPNDVSDPESPLTTFQKQILAVLGAEPLRMETICEMTDLMLVDVMAELTVLEMEGLVIRAGSGYALKP